VRNLTKDDFLVEEDGQAQQISGVDMETVGGKAQVQSIPTQLPILTSAAPLKSSSVAKGSRLVLLFFDFTSLDADEAARSLSAAKAYIGTVGTSDRVAVVSLAARLE